MVETTWFSPLFLLRCIIRHGWLWATWSYRNQARTIYGPFPAICFTDMPTAAFLETAASRQKRKQNISAYALTFDKTQMFSAGARPVIYGLSGSTGRIPNGTDGRERIIPEDLLSANEQYRYVTYSPTHNRWNIDWTHEREWRWPMRDKKALAEYLKQRKKFGCVGSVKDIPGLNLYSGRLDNIGVIVNNNEEANRIFHDILVLVDRGLVPPNMYEYVLISENIGDPEKLRSPDDEANAIAASAIDVQPFLDVHEAEDSQIAEEVLAMIDRVEAEAGPSENGEFGGCWLWITDNLHKVTRALIRKELIEVNEEGKYLLRLSSFSDDRSLRQREDMATKLGAIFQEAYGITTGFFSVLNSDDINGHPYYNPDFSENLLFYNNYFD